MRRDSGTRRRRDRAGRAFPPTPSGIRGQSQISDKKVFFPVGIRVLRQGWTNLDFADDEQVAQLRKLWESLELEILSVLEASNQLRESAEFELYQLVTKKPDLLDQIAAKQSQSLEAEIAKMKSEAEALAGEIEALTGQSPAMEAEARP